MGVSRPNRPLPSPARNKKFCADGWGETPSCRSPVRLPSYSYSARRAVLVLDTLTPLPRPSLESQRLEYEYPPSITALQGNPSIPILPPEDPNSVEPFDPVRLPSYSYSYSYSARRAVLVLDTLTPFPRPSLESHRLEYHYLLSTTPAQFADLNCIPYSSQSPRNPNHVRSRETGCVPNQCGIRGMVVSKGKESGRRRSPCSGPTAESFPIHSPQHCRRKRQAPVSRSIEILANCVGLSAGVRRHSGCPASLQHPDRRVRR